MVVKPSEGHPSEQNVGVFVCVCKTLQSRHTVYDHERSGLDL